MGLFDEEEEQRGSHPSFGLISIHRFTGGKQKLFGSALHGHVTKMSLTIKEAIRYHGLSEDRYHGGKQIIEVTMSAEQFTQLITTMNTGPGVPCTIDWVRDVGKVEEAPDDELEVERVQHGFSRNLGVFLKTVKKRSREIEDILAKKTVNKGDRASIRSTLMLIVQEIESNLPFAIDQFNEATGRIVTAAKSEVDAFVTAAITQTGLQGLKDISVRQLTAGDEDDEH